MELAVGLPAVSLAGVSGGVVVYANVFQLVSMG
jgi:hypothetical protein